MDRKQLNEMLTKTTIGMKKIKEYLPELWHLVCLRADKVKHKEPIKCSKCESYSSTMFTYGIATEGICPMCYLTVKEAEMILRKYLTSK